MLRKLYLDSNLKKKLFVKGAVNFKTVNVPKVKMFKSYQKVIKNIYYDKKSLIPKILIGERIFFHNGKEIISLKVTSNMLGYKISEFLYQKKIIQKKKVKK